MAGNGASDGRESAGDGCGLTKRRVAETARAGLRERRVVRPGTTFARGDRPDRAYRVVGGNTRSDGSPGPDTRRKEMSMHGKLAEEVIERVQIFSEAPQKKWACQRLAWYFRPQPKHKGAPSMHGSCLRKSPTKSDSDNGDARKASEERGRSSAPNPMDRGLTAPNCLCHRGFVQKGFWKQSA